MTSQEQEKQDRDKEKERFRQEYADAQIAIEDYKLRLANEKVAKQLGLK